jgi:hypothetical protein
MKEANKAPEVYCAYIAKVGEKEAGEDGVYFFKGKYYCFANGTMMLKDVDFKYVKKFDLQVVSVIKTDNRLRIIELLDEEKVKVLKKKLKD